MITFRDQGEFNLWVQWGSVYMNAHKMLPLDAFAAADLCLEECRKRQPSILADTHIPGRKQ